MPEAQAPRAGLPKEYRESVTLRHDVTHLRIIWHIVLDVVRDAAIAENVSLESIDILEHFEGVRHVVSKWPGVDDKPAVVEQSSQPILGLFWWGFDTSRWGMHHKEQCKCLHRREML